MKIKAWATVDFNAARGHYKLWEDEKPIYKSTGWRGSGDEYEYRHLTDSIWLQLIGDIGYGVFAIKQITIEITS